jgi:hypothetical protein
MDSRITGSTGAATRAPGGAAETPALTKSLPTAHSSATRRMNRHFDTEKAVARTGYRSDVRRAALQQRAQLAARLDSIDLWLLVVDDRSCNIPKRVRS